MSEDSKFTEEEQKLIDSFQEVDTEDPANWLEFIMVRSC